mgnify:CR=1 FL=1
MHVFCAFVQVALTQLNQISEQFKVDFCISISVEEKDLPDFAKEQVLISC